MQKKKYLFGAFGIFTITLSIFLVAWNSVLSGFLNFIPRIKNQNFIKLNINSEKEHNSWPDFFDDYSFQKFLDDNHTLSKWYNPDDVVKIESDFTYNNSRNFYLREEAAIAFADMARAFSNAFDFKAKLSINSARRSPEYQKKLSASCSNWRCAKPWTSEHEAWLALDIWVNWWNIKSWNGKYYQWLYDNAHLYGFHNTYQKWIEVDWKIVEAWHWRYVGKDLATTLHENNQTIAEYFYENIEKSDLNEEIEIVSDWIDINKKDENKWNKEDIKELIKLIDSLE